MILNKCFLLYLLSQKKSKSIPNKDIHASQLLFLKMTMANDKKQALPAEDIILYYQQLINKQYYQHQLYYQIIQMQAQKISFVLVILGVMLSQVVTQTTNNHCLNHCQVCQPHHPLRCISNNNCQWGYYDPENNNHCIHLPTTQVLHQEFAVKQSEGFKQKLQVWNADVKRSKCQLQAGEEINQFQVYGPFTGMTNIYRKYPLPQINDIYEVSFNLVRNQWIPSNDFLLFEIISQDNVVKSSQIKYQTRSTIQDLAYNVKCGQTRVIIEKYQFRINNANKTLKNAMTLVFSSFLLDSIWAITNINIISVCNNFALWNEKTDRCDSCDQKSYLSETKNGQLRCVDCPKLCSSCHSQTQCSICLPNAELKEGKCALKSNYTRRDMSYFHNEDKKTCSGNNFLVGSVASKIQWFILKKQGQHQFLNVSIDFSIYYNPNDWNKQSNNSIRMTINGKKELLLNYLNFTSKGTDPCKQIKGNRLAKVQLFVENITIHERHVSISFQLQSKDEMINFGVSDAYVQEQKQIEAQIMSKKTGKEEVNEQKEQLAVQSGQDKKLGYIQVDAHKKSNSKGSNRPKDFKFLLSSSLEQLWQPKIVADTSSNKQVQQMIELNGNSKSKGQTQQISRPTIQIMNKQDSKDEQENISIKGNSSQNERQLIKVEANNTNTSNITSKSSNPATYLPIASHNTTGLQIVINNIENKEVRPLVEIDTLKSNQYQLESYNLIDNNLHMFVAVKKSFKNGMLTVTNNLNQTINSTTSRLLVTAVTLATININRYDFVTSDQISAISTFSSFFRVFAWIALIVMIVMVMLGVGIVAEQNLISLQMLFLHIFIATELLPLSFRDVIAGLSITEHLNFIIQSFGMNLGNEWIGNIFKNGGIRLGLNNNIVFVKEIFPIIIANIIYLTWFILIVLFKITLSKCSFLGENSITVKIFDKIVKRKVNFFDQIWRYQLLAIIWVCFIQFKNYLQIQQANTTQVLNQLASIIYFLAFVLWPVFVVYYTRKLYYEAQYSAFIQTFEDIYYKKIPIYHLPSKNHRFGYPLFRQAKIITSVALIAFQMSIWITLPFLASINILQILYLTNAKIYTDQTYFKFKMMENLTMVLIQLLMLMLVGVYTIESSEAYVNFGYVLAGISFLLVLNCFGRMIYLGREKFRSIIGIVFEEMPELQQNMAKC